MVRSKVLLFTGVTSLCLAGLLAHRDPAAQAAGDEAVLRIQRDRGSERSEATIEVTGIGFPPRKTLPEGQSRLMARRAAILDGYRKLAEAQGMMREGESAHTGTKRVTSFIQGALIVETRYLPQGKVEVDLRLPVDLKRHQRGGGDLREVMERMSQRGLKVVEVERAVREISREEWMDLFAGQRADE